MSPRDNRKRRWFSKSRNGRNEDRNQEKCGLETNLGTDDRTTVREREHVQTRGVEVRELGLGLESNHYQLKRPKYGLTSGQLWYCRRCTSLIEGSGNEETCVSICLPMYVCVFIFTYKSRPILVAPSSCVSTIWVSLT